MVDRNRQATGAAQGSGVTTPGGIGNQQATPVKEQVQEKTADLKEQVQEKAVDLKEQVTAQATDKLSSQKDVASDGLNTVAHAFRQTSEQLRGNDQEGIAQYVDRAAGQVEQFAGYLAKSDLRGLARDAESFARREPALFLGGALAVGLLAARFLKSSSQGGQRGSSSWQGQEEWYGSTGSAAGGAPQLPARTGMGVGTAAPASVGRPAPMTSGLGTSPTAGLGTTSTTGASGTASARPSSTLGASGAAGTGTTPGTQPSDDVIVGGPPLPDDVIVGGPPREPGREGRR